MNNLQNRLTIHRKGGIFIAYKIYHLEREINDDIEFAVFKIGSYNKKVSQCLCHGTFGNIQILKYWAKKSGNLRLLKKYQIWEEQNNSISNMEDFPLPQEKYSFGFMNGAVGVAYEKLREIDDSLPWVLGVKL